MIAVPEFIVVEPGSLARIVKLGRLGPGSGGKALPVGVVVPVTTVAPKAAFSKISMDCELLGAVALKLLSQIAMVVPTAMFLPPPLGSSPYKALWNVA